MPPLLYWKWRNKVRRLQKYTDTELQYFNVRHLIAERSGIQAV